RLSRRWSLPLRGLNDLVMGCFQTEQPKLGKVAVFPALMVRSATFTASSCALPQNAAQTHADPAVQGSKRGPVTVLEVIEPTPQGLVQAGDHECQRVTAVPG